MVLILLACSPLAQAAPRRRAVTHPSSPAITRENVTLTAIRVAEGIHIPAFEPRLHWENAPFLDGVLLVAEQMDEGPARTALIERVAAVLLGSNDNIAGIYWGDGVAFSQAVMDLYRLTPPGDPRREALLGLLQGPMSFAEHAMRATPATAAPRNPWWMEGGYGTRFWQDDMYMVIPWLAMYGSSQDGLPANAKARELAYEWIESYLYDHRDAQRRAIPAARERSGLLLWDEQHALFQHAPETIGTDEFWGRGNGWSTMALSRAAGYLDAPYTGSQFAQTPDATQLRAILAKAAESIAKKQLPGGGWPSNLSRPLDCPIVETSATGFLTAFLARGVNEGWLDREKYTPIILSAFAKLMDRVDEEGHVHGIQPPGTGPAFCSSQMLATSHPTINVNYGAGAFLLAAAEILRMIALHEESDHPRLRLPRRW